ncbi:MAG: hypothetical protein JJ975_04225 [Bacteroidia bacterium]|nr:hypothetical protein [Bacteroidia bacterium]
MRNGFVIALAWPETRCKRAGAWYDGIMEYVGISNNGYYRVGHAAMIIVDPEDGQCRYFDFGRYHTPKGFGRVRSAETDHELRIHSRAQISDNGNYIYNLREILAEVYMNPSCHGVGPLHGCPTRVDLDKVLAFVKDMQDVDFVPYGPFVADGTNCSRFVNRAIQAGVLEFKEQLRLKLPWMISPTPMWNLRALSQVMVIYGDLNSLVQRPKPAIA